MRHRREPEHQEPETSTLEPHHTESAATHKRRRSAARNEDAEKQNVTPKSHAAEPKPSKGNFFERLAQMTEAEWDRYRVYVYRRWPRISKTGEPHYIAAF